MIRRTCIGLAVFWAVVLLCSSGHLALSAEPARQPVVVIAPLNGVINPMAAEFVESALNTAMQQSAEALVIKLDTPGGLDTSMRTIIKDILASRVPVAVYVAPSGGRAASAGAFITIAAHVSAMAPGTSIGAAHPVTMGEKMDEVMSAKMTNDAAAFIRSLAEQRGRNADWAEEAVRKSVSAGESEALKKGIIDLVAQDEAALIEALDGRKVVLPAGHRILVTKGAVVVRHDPGMRHKILNLIGDPTVAYLLLMLGFYGLFFELTNPGSLASGIIGSICLVLSLYALQTLPVNYAGVALIVIGIVLFILEVKITSYGLLTIGGLIALFLGSLMLFDTSAPFLRLSISVIVPAVLVSGLFFGLTVRMAWRAQRLRPMTGQEGLVGTEGIVRSPVGPEGGTVLIRGELWSAVAKEPIAVGERIIVSEVKGLTVTVRRPGA